jgi:hypothetical protein
MPIGVKITSLNEEQDENDPTPCKRLLTVASIFSGAMHTADYTFTLY